MTEIILAAPADFPRVRAFYHSLIEEMQHLPWFPCWEKDVYPTDASLLGYIVRGEMHLLISDGEIAAAAALSERLDCSDEIRWSSSVAESEYATVNMVAVHPRFARRGFAKQMIVHLQTLARAKGLRALRLDVVDFNEPARTLYTGLDFQYVDRETTVFDDGSSLTFELYEQIL